MRSDDPVDRLHLHHRATLGAALLDHDPVEPLDRVAAGGDAPAGNEGMNQRAQSAPDHRPPESRGDPDMHAEIFIAAFRKHGRASRRARGCWYVSIVVVVYEIKKKK